MRKFSRLVSRDKDNGSGKPERPEVRHGRHSDAGPGISGISAWIDPALLQPKRGSTAVPENVSVLIDAVKDYQLAHGSLVKLVRTEEEATILGRPIGAALMPLRFPRRCFDLARRLQVVYNELYTAVASDERWLEEALAPLLSPGSFASKLWNIHLQVREEGYAQEMSLGIFRSDYMLHKSKNRPQDPVVPKQVEFNTFSCAGIAHSRRISNMHRDLARGAAYQDLEYEVPLSGLPENHGVDRVVEGLQAGHVEYNRQFNTPPRKTAVLMVVQPFNVNTADERPFEYGLWAKDIQSYHIIWGQELLRCTTMGPNRELFFHPLGRKQGTAIEIAVVYHRAGYEEEEYSTAAGIECRLRLERSRAIKCPSVLCHLAGFKMVQQALASPGTLMRFVSPDKASRILDSFAPMYPLDAETSRGLRGRELARDPEMADNHVLKPSLEGGGHNIYRKDIPAFLAAQPEEQWRTYILMERIHPPETSHIMIGPRGVHQGPVETELGIVGTCLWRNHAAGDVSPAGAMPLNKQAGFTLKTKAKGINEMSVIKGYGCFDSPLLVEG